MNYCRWLLIFSYQVTEEDMRVRQEYLKQQRDKLLALKKQVRERRLGAAEMESETGGMSKKAQLSSY